MNQDKQPEALRLAQHLEQFRGFPDDLKAASELRRLHARVQEIEQQRTELLEALRMVQEAAIDMRGEDFNLTTEQWSVFHEAITKSEADT